MVVFWIFREAALAADLITAWKLSWIPVWIAKKQKSIDFYNFFEGPGPGVRGPSGRMGNGNWVILGFRPRKCTQFFLGPRTSDFRPDYGNPNRKRHKKAIFPSFFRDFSTDFRAYFRRKLPLWAFSIGIKLNFQAVIKSAASAASRKIQKTTMAHVSGLKHVWAKK